MNDRSEATILDRTWSSLRQALRDIGASRRSLDAIDPRPDLPDGDAEILREQMRACLNGRGGEVTARARAAALGRAYLSLDRKGRQRYLHILADDFNVDREAVAAAVESYHAAKSDDEKRRSEEALRAALEPPRMALLTQFNALQQGVKFLVDLRAELMTLSRDDPGLRGLDSDLKRLLTSWFDVGFLDIRRITWNAPAALLEKLINYEAVHEIRSWTDLKNRLDSDRRCYAFFHPRMPDEPLIFVEVALVSGMANDVHVLLDEQSPVEDPAAADTAIFYSISNAQKGLAGISFGNFLIKRVVDDLSGEFKNLRTFATLSPIPAFRRWLDDQFEAEGDGLLLEAERRAIEAAGIPQGGASLLARLLATESWHRDEALAGAAKPALMRLCAHFLLKEKGRGGRAADPVAHFHLSNGARMERLNWMGDMSDKGLRQSAGLMINYLYKLDSIDSNHEAYTGERKIAASAAMRSLAKA